MATRQRGKKRTIKQKKGRKTDPTAQFKKQVIERMERAISQDEAVGRCGVAFLEKLWKCEIISNAKIRQACFDRATKFYNDCMDAATVDIG